VLRIIVLCTSLFAALFGFAQQTDLGSWNVVNIKYNHSPKLSVFGEGQLRSLKFYNHFHYYEYKGGLNYLIHKSAQLTLGTGSYQTYREGGNFELPKNNNEFRLWPQIILSQELYSLKIEQRYRTEWRWTSNGFRNRFRYRVGVAHSFGGKTTGKKRFQIGVSNELFFTDREPYFERNRIQLSFNYKPTPFTTFQLGYLHQFDYKINDETGRDFLVVGFFLELFNHSNSKVSKKKQ
jgi:hypothetical protein